MFFCLTLIWIKLSFLGWTNRRRSAAGLGGISTSFHWVSSMPTRLEHGALGYGGFQFPKVLRSISRSQRLSHPSTQTGIGEGLPTVACLQWLAYSGLPTVACLGSTGETRLTIKLNLEPEKGLIPKRRLPKRRPPQAQEQHRLNTG